MPGLQAHHIGMNFVVKPVYGVAANIMARQIQVFYPGLVKRPDGLVHLFIRDPLPGWFTCSPNHLNLEAGALEGAVRHRQVKSTDHGVDGFIRQFFYHGQNGLDGGMTAAGDHHDAFALYPRSNACSRVGPIKKRLLARGPVVPIPAGSMPGFETW